MDDTTEILRRMLGAATGGMLRIGLVAVLAFLGLINMAAMPASVALFLSWFLAAVLVVSFGAMLFLGLRTSLFARDAEEQRPSLQSPELPAPDGQLTDASIEGSVGDLRFKEDDKDKVI